MSITKKHFKVSSGLAKRLSAGVGLKERYWELYLIMLPALGFLFLFKYVPYGSIVIAFQDYNIFKGVFESKFVGLDNFHRAFTNPDFYRILRNTIIINFVKMSLYIPLPIIMALLINEVTQLRLKRIVQTTLYLPHFLSWVIVAGLFSSLLSVNGGLVNQLIRAVGLKPIGFMFSNDYFRGVIVVSALWKEVGWGTIIYLAAIASVDPQMYEAAVIDGASKLRQIWSITLPTIIGTIVVVALLSLGSILKNSFEQVFVMYNPAVYKTADIINTYVYRHGVGQLEYSYTTAIGLFNGVVGFLLIIITNALSRKFFERSLW